MCVFHWNKPWAGLPLLLLLRANIPGRSGDCAVCHPSRPTLDFNRGYIVCIGRHLAVGTGWPRDNTLPRPIGVFKDQCIGLWRWHIGGFGSHIGISNRDAGFCFQGLHPNPPLPSIWRIANLCGRIHLVQKWCLSPKTARFKLNQIISSCMAKPHANSINLDLQLTIILRPESKKMQLFSRKCLLFKRSILPKWLLSPTCCALKAADRIRCHLVDIYSRPWNCMVWWLMCTTPHLPTASVAIPIRKRFVATCSASSAKAQGKTNISCLWFKHSIRRWLCHNRRVHRLNRCGYRIQRKRTHTHKHYRRYVF